MYAPSNAPTTSEYADVDGVGSGVPSSIQAAQGGACPVARLCPSYGVGETDPVKARTLLAYELAPGAELPDPPPGPLSDDVDRVG